MTSRLFCYIKSLKALRCVFEEVINVDNEKRNNSIEEESNVGVGYS